MKNNAFPYLACACLVIAAFLGGMFLGRNSRGVSLQASTFPQSSIAQGTQPANTGTEAPSSPAAAAPTDSDGKVNINTADLETLMTLDGIGEVYAQRIIDYRNTNGPFTSIAEITNVSGIGVKRFEAIMDRITIGG